MRDRHYQYDYKPLLRDLDIYLDMSTTNILVGTDDKKIHDLLSRLAKTKRECFRIYNSSICVSTTYVFALINNLENLR
jgi:hypothetical protein